MCHAGATDWLRFSSDPSSARQPIGRVSPQRDEVRHLLGIYPHTACISLKDRCEPSRLPSGD